MKTSQPFYIIDNQVGRYMGDGVIFDSLRQAILYLKRYHSIDTQCSNRDVGMVLEMDWGFNSLNDECITDEIVGENINKVYKGTHGKNWDRTDFYKPMRELREGETCPAGYDLEYYLRNTP